MQENLRRRLAEDKPDFFRPEDIREIINWSHRQVVKDITPIQYLEVREINSVVGQSEYDQPNDFMILYDVAYGDPDSGQDPKILTYLSKKRMMREYSERTPTGTPVFCFPFGDGEFFIVPATPDAYTGGITAFGLVRPENFSDSSDGARVQEVEDAMVPMAAYRCWLMMGGQFLEKADIALKEAKWLEIQARKVCGVKRDIPNLRAWVLGHPRRL